MSTRTRLKSTGARPPRAVLLGVLTAAVIIVGLLGFAFGTNTEAAHVTGESTGAQRTGVDREPAAAASPSIASSVPPATSNPSTSPTADSPPAGTALAAVDQLTVRGRAPKTGYTRDAYGGGWAQHDDCNTREIILRRDLDDVTVAANSDCTVVSGTLNDPYTGKTEKLTATTLSSAQIDHVVPVSDSWQKGAQQWSRSKRERYYNDPLNLLVTTGSVNASKGDGDAATWLPPNKAFRCTYVARQVSVKKRYEIWVTKAEQQAMRRVLQACPEQKMITTAQAERQHDLDPDVATASTSTPKGSPSRSRPSGRADPRFPTCAAANRAGYGPYVKGKDPEYRWYRDRDRDGRVCEL